MPNLNQKNAPVNNTANQEKSSQIYLRLSDLIRDYSLPKSTVYFLVKTQGFPKQIKLSTRCAVWRRSDVEAWFSKREAMGAS